jgi:hypothetical protein
MTFLAFFEKLPSGSNVEQFSTPTNESKILGRKLSRGGIEMQTCVLWFRRRRSAPGSREREVADAICESDSRQAVHGRKPGEHPTHLQSLQAAATEAWGRGESCAPTRSALAPRRTPPSAVWAGPVRR